MIQIERFVAWLEDAGPMERREGAFVVARMFTERTGGTAVRGEGERALYLLLSDRSVEVRKTLVRQLLDAQRLPAGAISLILRDNDMVACPFVEASSLLNDDQLINLLRDASNRLVLSVARRHRLTQIVCVEVAQRADITAAIALLDNPQACISQQAYAVLCERFASEAIVREALLRRHDLPMTIRHELVRGLAGELASLELLTGLCGFVRAERIASEALEGAVVSMADSLDAADRSPFVEHLRRTGTLNTAFLVRMVCLGNIDLFAEILVRLSGKSEAKIRSIVGAARVRPLVDILVRCGIAEAPARLLSTGVSLWREIDSGLLKVADEEVPRIIMNRLAETAARSNKAEDYSEVMRYLSALDSEVTCTAARQRFPVAA